jgi:hypothetical protein
MGASVVLPRERMIHVVFMGCVLFRSLTGEESFLLEYIEYITFVSRLALETLRGVVHFPSLCFYRQ